MQQICESDITKAAKLVLDGDVRTNVTSMKEMVWHPLLGTHPYDAVQSNRAGTGTGSRKPIAALALDCYSDNVQKDTGYRVSRKVSGRTKQDHRSQVAKGTRCASNAVLQYTPSAGIFHRRPPTKQGGVCTQERRKLDTTGVQNN